MLKLEHSDAQGNVRCFCQYGHMVTFYRALTIYLFDLL